jgi:hypothetical protein
MNQKNESYKIINMHTKVGGLRVGIKEVKDLVPDHDLGIQDPLVRDRITEDPIGVRMEF